MNQTRTEVSVGLLGVTFYWGQAPICAQAILRFPSFDLPAFVTIVYFVTAANKRIISKRLFFFSESPFGAALERSLHTQITCRMCDKPWDLSPSWLTNLRRLKAVCCLLTSLFFVQISCLRSLDFHNRENASCPFKLRDVFNAVNLTCSWVNYNRTNLPITVITQAAVVIHRSICARMCLLTLTWSYHL